MAVMVGAGVVLAPLLFSPAPVPAVAAEHPAPPARRSERQHGRDASPSGWRQRWARRDGPSAPSIRDRRPAALDCLRASRRGLRAFLFSQWILRCFPATSAAASETGLMARRWITGSGSASEHDGCRISRPG